MPRRQAAQSSSGALQDTLPCRHRSDLTMAPPWPGSRTLRGRPAIAPPAQSPAAPSACGPAAAPWACAMTVQMRSVLNVRWFATTSRRSRFMKVSRVQNVLPHQPLAVPSTWATATDACRDVQRISEVRKLLSLLGGQCHGFLKGNADKACLASSSRHPLPAGTAVAWRLYAVSNRGGPKMSRALLCLKKDSPVLGALRPAGHNERLVPRWHVLRNRRPHALVHDVVHHLQRRMLSETLSPSLHQLAPLGSRTFVQSFCSPEKRAASAQTAHWCGLSSSEAALPLRVLQTQRPSVCPGRHDACDAKQAEMEDHLHGGHAVVRLLRRQQRPHDDRKAVHLSWARNDRGQPK